MKPCPDDNHACYHEECLNFIGCGWDEVVKNCDKYSVWRMFQRRHSTEESKPQPPYHQKDIDVSDCFGPNVGPADQYIYELPTMKPHDQETGEHVYYSKQNFEAMTEYDENTGERIAPYMNQTRGVEPLTDQDKQRIGEAARQHADKFTIADISVFNHNGFIAGATYEHPIAYNQAIEDVLNLFADGRGYEHFIEKLRKP